MVDSALVTFHYKFYKSLKTEAMTLETLRRSDLSTVMMSNCSSNTAWTNHHNYTFLRTSRFHCQESVIIYADIVNWMTFC